ncbi:reverse transcriptase domain, reverse transcriptase zinc-binding domain protein [Tanacetum coccineum]
MLINGSSSKEFKMKRGLRQGDPLSPFLFLIVVEALQVMTMEACNKGIFKGLSLDDDVPNISLLQYTDDALFFSEWSVANARNLVHILDFFHDVSGLKINLAKSRIFGFGIHMADVANSARAINCSYGSLPFNYLGQHVGKRMNKLDAWNGVVGKLSERLTTWKINLLSISGRLTLVKSVLGSLPLYYLLLFRAIALVISQIEALRRNFFWGFKENEKKICDAWIKDISPLKFHFPRLFALEMNTNCLVADRSSLLDGVWKGIWAWSRQPRGRTLDDLSALSYLINGVVLDRSHEVNWSWSLDESGSFSVRSLCKFIQSKLFVIETECPSFKWNSWVPEREISALGGLI